MSESTYELNDRRPLAARSWSISRWMATYLAQHHVSPNAISLTGLGACAIAGCLLAATSEIADYARWLWLGAAVLIVVRALANMLDGMVAVESKRSSALGELFNEVPDRLSDSAMLIGLGFAKGGQPILGCLAALAAVGTAYVRAVGKVAGAPQDYRGPMAKIHRMASVVIICCIGAIEPNLMAVRSTLLSLTLPVIALSAIIAGCVLTSIRRLVTTASKLKSQGP